MKDVNLVNILKSIFRDENGFQKWYEAIAVIEFDGRLSPTGDSAGHYTCDVKEKITNMTS